MNAAMSRNFQAGNGSVVVENLEPWTEYRVNLAAETCGGEGRDGQFVSVNVTTEEGGDQNFL